MVEFTLHMTNFLGMRYIWPDTERLAFHYTWRKKTKKNFFRNFIFMTDMTTKWLNFVIHDQNFGNLTRRTWNFKRCTLFMTNFLGFEKFDMLTKMVEFLLHMTNIFGIWKIRHANKIGWIFATHDKNFRNLMDLTC